MLTWIRPSPKVRHQIRRDRAALPARRRRVARERMQQHARARRSLEIARLNRRARRARRRARRPSRPSPCPGCRDRRRAAAPLRRASRRACALPSIRRSRRSARRARARRRPDRARPRRSTSSSSRAASPGMRRENPAAARLRGASASRFRPSASTISGSSAVEQPPPQRARPRRPAEPRAEHRGVRRRRARSSRSAGPSTARAMTSGAPREHGRDAVGMGRDVDEPRAGSQRRLRREPDRARHRRAAADDQQPAVRALVRGPRSRRQRALDLLDPEPHERRREARGRDRPATRDRRARSARRSRRPRRGTALASSATNVTVTAARTATPSGQPVSACEPARHVERQHGRRRRVDRGDRGRELALERPVGADAEQRVDDRRRARTRARSPCALRETLDRYAGRRAVFVRSARVALEALRRRDREHAHRDALLVREARKHVAVAGVVAGRRSRRGPRAPAANARAARAAPRRPRAS